ncbi:VOC family protein [Brevibacterium litoralis]|uniref:VOC family protein n=1 Tax=Brevibacterium litoralis TaxID=3138935 RepID=UPI0032EEF8F4
MNHPCWIELSSPDVAAARAFYGSLFGWEFEEPGPMGFGVTALKDGKRVAGLSPQPADAPAGQPAFWSVYFRVASLDDFLEASGEAGGQAMMAIPEFDGTAGVALVADPAGTAFGVLEYPDERGFTTLGAVGAPMWFELHTKDFSVRDFYSRAFEWEFTVEGDSDDFRYATYELGGVREPEKEAHPVGGLLDNTKLPIPAHWESYIRVDDVAATTARVKELGGEVLADAHESLHGTVARYIDAQNAAFTVIRPN